MVKADPSRLLSFSDYAQRCLTLLILSKVSTSVKRQVYTVLQESWGILAALSLALLPSIKTPDLGVFENRKFQWILELAQLAAETSVLAHSPRPCLLDELPQALRPCPRSGRNSLGAAIEDWQ